MRCQNCSTENPEGARLCIHCATPVKRRCHKCGAENPPEARYCAQCATSLSAEGGQPSKITAGAAASGIRVVVESCCTEILPGEVSPGHAWSGIDDAGRHSQRTRWAGLRVQATDACLSSGIISETTVEQVMTDLEKRALSDGMRISRIEAFCLRLLTPSRRPLAECCDLLLLSQIYVAVSTLAPPSLIECPSNIYILTSVDKAAQPNRWRSQYGSFSTNPSSYALPNVFS